MDSHLNLLIVEASKRERFALRKLLERMNRNDEFIYQAHMTSEYDHDRYDMCLQKTSNGNILKSFYVEAKIRSGVYDDYVMETKKYRAIDRIIKYDICDTNDEILYINFLPEKTLIWNVSRLIREGKIFTSKLLANKVTMKSKTDKVNKTMMFLNPEDATVINYAYSEEDYLNTLRLIELSKIEHEKKMKNPDIFDGI